VLDLKRGEVRVCGEVAGRASGASSPRRIVANELARIMKARALGNPNQSGGLFA
jgi:hypothetical protein